MTRFEIRKEKLVGSRSYNYAIVDKNTEAVIVRYADEKVAENLKDKMNARNMEGEGE